MKRAVLVCLVVPSLLFAETPLPQHDARLTAASAEVYLRPAGFPENEWVMADTGTPLEAGDTLRTGPGSAAEISLGGDSVVLLEENTQLIVRSLDVFLTRLYLSLGLLTAKILAVKKGQEEFQVETPIALAAVRGTEFGISYVGDEAPLYVGVYDEGTVVLRSPNAPDVTLTALQETEMRKGSAPLPPRALMFFEARRARALYARGRAQQLRADWRLLSVSEKRQIRERLQDKPRVRPAAKIIAPQQLERKPSPRPKRQRRERKR